MLNRRDLLRHTTVGLSSLAALPLARAAGASLPGAQVAPLFAETMRHADKARSGVMLGGIGAGGGELRKDGRFVNWTAFNNAPRGTGPLLPFDPATVIFFTVRTERPGHEPRLKVLQIEEGVEVATIPTHVYEFPWLSGIDRIDYEARFPIARLRFSDPELPLAIEMQAMGFFIPHDLKHSSLPAIAFSLTVRNTSREPVEVMLLAAQRNVVGYDVPDKLATAAVHDVADGKLVEASATGLPEGHDSAGTVALLSQHPSSSHYLGWEHRHPYWERVLRARALPNVDETARRVSKDNKTGKTRALDRIWNSLARSVSLPAGGSFEHGFLMTWHFPHQRNEARTRVEGNAYNNHFASAREVAAYVAQHQPELTAKTRGFVDDLYASTVDRVLLDQTNVQLNTFITSSYLTQKGQFGILEGLLPTRNMGPLATVDVSAYGAWPIATLFPELQQGTMRALRDLQAPSGEIGHSLQRDFGQLLKGVAGVSRRLDLNPQFVSMVLRDYFWTGDRAYLTQMWPAVKAALEYTLRERDLNGDGMPDMEGIMSSYDNFPMYGTAAYIGTQWLAALAAAKAAATTLGDSAAAERYGNLYEASRTRFESALWNGRYYRLWNDDGGKHGGRDEGCLTDQLVGEWVGAPVGLGPFVPAQHLDAALDEVLRLSYRPDFGLRNCSWPGATPWKDIPDNIWVDQANTCWSGVELAFASLLLYRGKANEALAVVRTVDERYRRAGRTWDHQEFGGHYYRAMASWMLLPGVLGLSLREGVLGFAPARAGAALKPRGGAWKAFFATPTATAFYGERRLSAGLAAALDVRTGTLTLNGLGVTFPKAPSKPLKVVLGSSPAALAPVEGARLTMDGARANIRFATPLTLAAGARLELRPGA